VWAIRQMEQNVVNGKVPYPNLFLISTSIFPIERDRISSSVMEHGPSGVGVVMPRVDKSAPIARFGGETAGHAGRTGRDRRRDAMGNFHGTRNCSSSTSAPIRTIAPVPRGTRPTPKPEVTRPAPRPEAPPGHHVCVAVDTKTHGQAAYSRTPRGGL